MCSLEESSCHVAHKKKIHGKTPKQQPWLCRCNTSQPGATTAPIGFILRLFASKGSFTPFNAQPPIYDGLFKKNLRDTSLKLNHVTMAMRFRFASSRLVLFEFGSFQRSIEVPKAKMSFATHANARFGMKHLIHAWLIPICFFFGYHATAQTGIDTLSQVQLLKAKGQCKEAEKLLHSWTQTHTRTAEVLWLEAQLAWLRRHFSKADRLYREAMAADPANLYLQLDHAEALLNAGRFAEARIRLAGLTPSERRDAHALFVQAKYAFWTGNYREAEQLVSRALRADRNKADAQALAAEIRAALSLWLDISMVQMDDDQPLRKLEPRLEAGQYLHPLADMRIEARSAFFDTGQNNPHAHQVGLSNTFRYIRTGTTLRVGAGVFALRDQGMGLIGGVEARQRLPEGLSLMVGWDRQPYTRNVTSLDFLVLEAAGRVILDWQERHGFWAQAGGISATYGDANRVLTYWAWLLSPPMGGRTWKFRTGYGFNYADSHENRFVSDRPLEAWLDPFDPAVEITGIFAPYFTPQHMRIHQWVGSFSWEASKQMQFYIQGSYGLWARAENPYLFLDLDPNGALFIQRDFLDLRFHPFEVGGSLVWTFTPWAQAKASYQFTRNFFYENQTIVLALHLLPGYKT
jgi:Tfp pilus assembly protein PilF